MRHKWIFLVILLLGILNQSAVPFGESAESGESAEPRRVKITYIANEGFLIQAGQKYILVDAIFGDEDLDFCAVPTPEALAQMASASGVFARVDLVAVTHNHVDHFRASLVARHMLANENGSFLSCAQCVDELTEQVGYDSFQDRVIDITPDSLFYQDTLINGIGVRVYRLAHGPYLVLDPETGVTENKHRLVQNLGFVFNVDGIRIFHCGDSGPRCWDDYEHFRLDREGIDIALLGRGFLASETGFGVDIIRNQIKPGHIVLMHIHPDAIPHYREVAEKVKDEFPSVTIFESLMDSREFLIP